MLEALFEPRSVAVIGASRKKNSAGQGVLKSLLSGGVFKSPTNKPFKGNVYAVNPNAEIVLGVKCHDSVKDIRGKVDLAVIAVPAKFVPSVIDECAEKGVGAAIVISAGFSEVGNSEKDLLGKGVRILGPNCLGMMRPVHNLNASFGPCMAPGGEVAFFSQSGALIDSVIDWSLEAQYGFSAVVSMGNQADIDVVELLRWAEEDKDTKSIAIYLEGLKDGRDFMDVARKMTKPIVVLKAGRGNVGRKAVSSHTGSMAGSYEVYKSAFAQVGVHVAENVDELFEIAQALAQQPPCKNNIAIITNGGGAGVLCADHCENLGINLATLNKSTLKKLDASGTMHPAYSRGNPLDIVGDALHDRYDAAINAVLEQKDVYGLIIIQTLQTMTEPMLDAEAVLKARKKFPGKPIITSYMGGKFSKKAINLLESNHVPDFNVPYKAARAMKALVDENQ